MRKWLLLCLCAGAIVLCAACSKGKMEVDKGDPNKPATEKVSNTPTVTNTPTPTVTAESPLNTFSMIFLKDADSVWFLTKQEETDVLLYERETVDRVMYKHGREITVFYIDEGDILEWFKLSDDDIIARAKDYPYITFDVEDAMFYQADEGDEVYNYTPEGVCFLNGSAVEKKGVNLPDGGLFTIPAGIPFSSMYHGIMISGFVYDGREIDMGTNVQYFMVCATDILYRMDGAGQVGTQFYSADQIAARVKEARKNWQFVGTDREPYLEGCEVYYDPGSDSYVMTDKMYCDTVIPKRQFWARTYDPDLTARQYWYVHEGGGGYYVFDPAGKNQSSAWLSLYPEGTGVEPEYMIYAVGNVFMRLKGPVSHGKGEHSEEVRIGRYVPDEQTIVYPFVKTMAHLPVRPDEQVSGEFLVDGKDYSETYRQKIAELLESTSESEWTEMLYDSSEEVPGGEIYIELTVRKEPATDTEEAHVSYTLTYSYKSDVVGYSFTETYGK